VAPKIARIENLLAIGLDQKGISIIGRMVHKVGSDREGPEGNGLFMLYLNGI